MPLDQSNQEYTMDETKIATFMGQVSEALKNQSLLMEKMDGSISTLRDDVAAVKGDVKLLRSESVTRRISCDGNFGDYAKRLETHEGRLARDYVRLQALESQLKTQRAIANAEDIKIQKSRNSVQYAIAIVVVLLSLFSTVASYRAMNSVTQVKIVNDKK